MWRTFKISTANCITDKQFRSVWTTRLATLRWTNNSPGSRSTISLAGTRLSEQPIHRYSGSCWRESLRKNSGSSCRMRPAQALLFPKRWLSVCMGDSTSDSLQSRGRDESRKGSGERKACQRDSVLEMSGETLQPVSMLAAGALNHPCPTAPVVGYYLPLFRSYLLALAPIGGVSPRPGPNPGSERGCIPRGAGSAAAC